MNDARLPGASETLMFAEAAQAADVVATQFTRNEAVIAMLAADLRRNPPPFVATCARGSSDHAATYAKYLFETQLGIEYRRGAQIDETGAQPSAPLVGTKLRPGLVGQQGVRPVEAVVAKRERPQWRRQQS